MSVTFDQFNASLLNRSVHYFQKSKKKKCADFRTVCIYIFYILHIYYLYII